MNNKDYNDLPALLSKDIIDRVKRLSPAQLCDGMEKLDIYRNGCMDADLMPLDENKIMIGTACTVDTDKGDNFPIHIAVYNSKPGYVLIVSGKGYTERTYIGDLLGATAEAVGLNGIVVDGYVRDKIGLSNLNIPIYSKGIMQRTPAKKGPGKINTVVKCAGIDVAPGDFVVGDCDGVTVVPRDMIDQVLEFAEQKALYEENRRKTIDEYIACLKQGKELIDIEPSWIKDINKG